MFREWVMVLGAELQAEDRLPPRRCRGPLLLFLCSHYNQSGKNTHFTRLFTHPLPGGLIFVFLSPLVLSLLLIYRAKLKIWLKNVRLAALQVKCRVLKELLEAFEWLPFCAGGRQRRLFFTFQGELSLFRLCVQCSRCAHLMATAAEQLRQGHKSPYMSLDTPLQALRLAAGRETPSYTCTMNSKYDSICREEAAGEKAVYSKQSWLEPEQTLKGLNASCAGIPVNRQKFCHSDIYFDSLTRRSWQRVVLRT